MLAPTFFYSDQLAPMGELFITEASRPSVTSQRADSQTASSSHFLEKHKTINKRLRRLSVGGSVKGQRRTAAGAGTGRTLENLQVRLSDFLFVFFSESGAGIVFLTLRVCSSFTSGDWLLTYVETVSSHKEKAGGEAAVWICEIQIYAFVFYLFIYLSLREDSVKADHSVNSRSAWAVINTSISIKELNRLDWWARGNTKWGKKIKNKK